MNIRLTETIKRNILERALKHGFEKKEAELKERQHNLGLAVYNDVYSKKTQIAMAALPAGYLREDSSIMIRFGSTESRACWDGKKRIAEKHYGSYAIAKVYDATHKLTEQFCGYDKERGLLYAERRQAKDNVLAILNSVATLKRLQEVWPECVPFIKDYLTINKPMLPTIPVKAVNKQLGLPA